MTWVRLDEDFTDHPKVQGLSNEAHRLAIAGLCYANRFRTDGWLNTLAVRALAAPIIAHAEQLVFDLAEKEKGSIKDLDVVRSLPSWSAIANELVATKIWDRKNHGFAIHDYHDYQPTAERARAIAEARSLAGRRGNEARWQNSQPDRKPIASDRKTDRKSIARSRSRKREPLLIGNGEVISEELSSTASRSRRVPPSFPFETFWTSYPRKVGKAKARKAYAKLSEPDQQKASAVVGAFAAAWADASEERRLYIVHPSVWLNQGRFDDDPAEWKRMASSTNGSGEPYPSRHEVEQFNRTMAGTEPGKYDIEFKRRFGVAPRKETTT